MAKRFTSTEKWDKEWFQMLTPRLKCLWQYITDRSDHAGVWEANYRLASFCIGEEVTEGDLAAFGERVEVLGDNKVWLTGFVGFQYGKLSATSKPHASVIKLLEKHNLPVKLRESETLSKPLPKGLVSIKDKDKVKDKEKDKVKDNSEAREIIDFFNSVAKRDFRKTENNLSAISVRLSDTGITSDGVKAMIKRQTALWGGDPKMAEHLCITTLFRKSNFDKYYDNRLQPTGNALAKAGEKPVRYGNNGLPMEVIQP